MALLAPVDLERAEADSVMGVSDAAVSIALGYDPRTWSAYVSSAIGPSAAPTAKGVSRHASPPNSGANGESQPPLWDARDVDAHRPTWTLHSSHVFMSWHQERAYLANALRLFCTYQRALNPSPAE